MAFHRFETGFPNELFRCVHIGFQERLIQGRRKLIFTGPGELAGLGWGFEKQVFEVTVLLEYFDLTRLIMQLSSPGASSKMGLRENCLKFPPPSLLAPLLVSKFELLYSTYSYFTVSATSITSTSKWSSQNWTSWSGSYALVICLF